MRSTLKLAQVALIIKLLFENYGLFLLIYWRRASLNAKSWESELSAHIYGPPLFFLRVMNCKQILTIININRFRWHIT